MTDQTEEINVFTEIIGWVAVNTLGMFLIGVSFYLTNISTVANNKVIYPIVDVISSISFLGGGVLIAICQWMFLRHLQPKITGGGWIWILSGFVSSIGAFFFVAFSILALGDYPKEKDNLLFIFLVISEQIIFLSIVQGLILRANKYQKVLHWVLLNIFGYVLAVVFSYGSIFIWTDNLVVSIVLSSLFMMIITGVSGWELLDVLKPYDESGIDISIPESITKYKNDYFVQANLENQDFRGQNLDGVDFRKANLRMAILEDVSCEPIRVKKKAPGWLVIFFAIFEDGSGSSTWASSFFKEKMKSTDFSEADLTRANLKNAKLREANFHDAILKQANLTNASLVNADLSNADLTNSNLSYTDMSDALLYGTNLEGADLTGAKLDGADLEDANLKNAILKGVDLREVDLANANLTGADLTNTIMPEE